VKALDQKQNEMKEINEKKRMGKAAPVETYAANKSKCNGESKVWLRSGLCYYHISL